MIVVMGEDLCRYTVFVRDIFSSTIINKRYHFCKYDDEKSEIQSSYLRES